MNRATIAKGLLSLVLLLIAAIWGLIWAFQTYAIYTFGQDAQTPAAFDLDEVRVASFETFDGNPGQAWVANPQGDRPVILTLHGNHASIGPSMGTFTRLINDGFGIVMLQYRGSNGLGGTPNEATLVADAMALYDQLDDVLGMPVPVNRRLLHGFSLGGALASQVGAQRDFAGIVLQATPYRGCLEYQRYFYGFPFCRLMWDERFDTVDHVRRIAAPIRIIHGTQDWTIPVAEARQLLEAAPEGSDFVELPGGHADLARHGALEALAEFALTVTEAQ